ncbi:energy transducer TonB [Muricoccus radiodurans]|uniref:energy transducer TonB n=1 Tax=Muricoccus radiodurans TaxID=2231721 RepID=UPI003CEF4C7E
MTAWVWAPTAAPVWRPRRRRAQRRAWPWAMAAVLHGAVLAGVSLALHRDPPPEARIEEGVPLVWSGPIGTGEGAPELSPPAEAAPPPTPPAQPALQAPPELPPLPPVAEAPAPPQPPPPPAMMAEAPPGPATPTIPAPPRPAEAPSALESPPPAVAAPPSEAPPVTSPAPLPPNLPRAPAPELALPPPPAAPPAPPPPQLAERPPSPPVPSAAPPGPPEQPTTPPRVAATVPPPVPAQPPSPPRPRTPPTQSLAEAEPLPLPPPPAPPPPPERVARDAPPTPPTRPSRDAPPSPNAPSDAARLAALGAVRLGAGAEGAPGETSGVGAPRPGCADSIGYPPGDRARGVVGAVGMRLRVSDDGRVVEARVTETSGYQSLDEAARRGIRRCRFSPALRNGEPVWGSRDYRVVFRLE